MAAERSVDAALARAGTWQTGSTDLLTDVLASAPVPRDKLHARRRKITMTRLAYVLTSVIVVSLLLGGLLHRAGSPDGASLLIGAAAAMEETDTIHIRGYSGTVIERPWGQVGSEGYYEHWLSSAGYRRQWFDADGDFIMGMGSSVEAGLSWTYYPQYQLVWTLPIGVERARESADRARKRYLEGQIMVEENVEQMGFEPISTRRVTRDDIELFVVEVDTGAGCREYDIDTATGRLLAYRDYRSSESGRVPSGETHFEYAVSLPGDVLQLEVPPGWIVKEGVSEENGDIALAGAPGDDIAPDDPRLLAAQERLALADATRLKAETGEASWREVEQAYLAVADPRGPLAYTEVCSRASELLGLMYARQGRFEDALAILPAPAATYGQQGLVRAWCSDALGNRDEAVRIYRKLARTYGSFRDWGRLGLEQPTSPGPLKIRAGRGEVLLSPTSGWRVSAHRSLASFCPGAVIDGDFAVRWAAGGGEDGSGQESGNWLELDFGEPIAVRRVVLDHQGSTVPCVDDWPRGIEARFTSDGQTWRNAHVDPAGPMTPASVTFNGAEKVEAIRFELTEAHSPERWSIYEVLVFAPAN
jgi:hypothetical protein